MNAVKVSDLPCFYSQPRVAECRFRFYKAKLHQPACHIVNVDQRIQVLKPVMVTTIIQNQLTTSLVPASAQSRYSVR
nr:MAG TPA: hypothetical protein [Caudoviricetes sp.]